MYDSLTVSPVTVGVFCTLSASVAVLLLKIRSLIRRYQHSRIPALAFSKIRVQHPNSDNRIGFAILPLENTNGGEAKIQSATLKIVDHGPVLKPGRLRTTQAIPASNNPVKLRSDVPTHALTLPKTNSPSLRKQQSHNFTLQLSSDEHHWYRMTLEVVWTDTRLSTENKRLCSNQFYMEFPAA
ncbi:hypothetical protein [Teredinibacter haidensis]|uniref:hypothetical protein n=1 Tax=Teredinibacter haidensis TaxID=2731755 RepID=UPI0009490A85|nr:hypothetical protein [Teredinibacter haidensis]